MTAVDNLKRCQQAIAQLVSERKSGSVTLIAVSKFIAQERIQPLLKAGHRTFGENRVQEALQKWPSLKARYPDIELHLIGPLQTNKIGKAIGFFDLIHTIDRQSLVEAIDRRFGHTLHPKQRCFIQVNTGLEPQKSGVLPAELDALVERCRQSSALEVIGLMTIPPLDAPPQEHFEWLAQQAKRLELPELSMGMSADFRLAIVAGATYIRIGTTVFGKREPMSTQTIPKRS